MHKITLKGKDGVGKSSLMLRHIQGKFVENYDPTIDDLYNHCLKMDGKNIIQSIYDTNEETDFSPGGRAFTIDTQGVFLCFSLNDKKSFDYLMENAIIKWFQRRSEQKSIVL